MVMFVSVYGIGIGRVLQAGYLHLVALIRNIYLPHSGSSRRGVAR